MLSERIDQSDVHDLVDLSAESIVMATFSDLSAQLTSQFEVANSITGVRAKINTFTLSWFDRTSMRNGAF